MKSQVGLYIHIPFCAALCHYCDFAKTANFQPGVVEKYFQALESHLKYWLNLGEAKGLFSKGDLVSVFFGGGTPSLFSREYQPLFQIFAPWLADHAEITLEANPDNIEPHHLELWKSIGFNRISIGVQTFDSNGLTFLKRIHNGDEAKRSVEMAAKIFTRVNIDLIYGWKSQTHEMWKDDLSQALDLPANHISLYNLTYEPRTPIGRAKNRGKFTPHCDDTLADFYGIAQEICAHSGWQQYEVSNWSRPGLECKQNEIYWSGASYIGVGSGAAGFFANLGPFGYRYQYARNERGLKQVDLLSGSGGFLGEDLNHGLPIEVENSRTDQDWLLERVGSSLRCKWGFSISEAEEKLARKFVVTPHLTYGLKEGLVSFEVNHGEHAFVKSLYKLKKNENKVMLLRPDQWFLEQMWAQEVIKGFGF